MTADTTDVRDVRDTLISCEKGKIIEHREHALTALTTQPPLIPVELLPPKVRLTSTGMVFPKDMPVMSFADFKAVLHELLRAEKALRWSIGDWVNWGEGRCRRAVRTNFRRCRASVQ